MSMQLRVELPAYDHKWSISVTESATIHDVKAEIEQTCTGNPRPAGQRLLYRGRILEDNEKVIDLWKTPSEVKLVHLAVNPSAWASQPPSTDERAPSPTSTPTPPLQSYLHPQRSFQHSTPSDYPHPLTYVLFKHQTALAVLTEGKTSAISVSDYDTTRAASLNFVERSGWTWPAVLDDPFPPSSPGGVQYDIVAIDGQSYLNLKSPGVEPTAAQKHALKLLSYTFPILSLPPQISTASRPISSRSIQLPPHITQHVQQLEQHLQQAGLHPLRPAGEPNRAANANPNGLPNELRAILLRQTLYSYIYLAFRTVLLLYFISPTRKPIFGLLVLVWVLYEIWRPIQAGLAAAARRQEQQQQQANAGQPPAPGAIPNQAANEQGNAAGPNGNGAPIPPPRLGDANSTVIDRLATLNVGGEDAILDATDGPIPPPPSLSHKAITFVTLLLATVHPALWNRRRAALRKREGRIKTEANARARIDPPLDEGQEPSEEDRNRARSKAELVARHLRRPAWVREYMERVVSGDWVDDAD